MQRGRDRRRRARVLEPAVQSADASSERGTEPGAAPVVARAVLLGGASGSGKSRLAEASGLPVLRLDDFYRAGDDPALPRLPTGEVDWDHPGSWHAERALAALESLVTTGTADVPVYDIAANGPSGTRTVALEGAPLFVAEGIFAGAIAQEARRRGLLADAVVVHRGRWTTALLRLARDVREGRKRAGFLVRRGVMLARREPEIIAALREAGCTPMRPRAIRRMLRAPSATGRRAA